MAYKINSDCISCGACESECPVACIHPGSPTYTIKEDDCISCGACAGICPTNAIVEG
ncbi:MAG: 4Fe-4S binding protein [Defluviitaleaceae bacterium]|nr:4Fe-4S binding protein [Defluviitaleaceae bacterium]